MRSILFDYLAFKETKEQYSKEERMEIYNQFQERINKATKKISVVALIDKINNS
jgi:hypothetical protein